MNGVSGPGLLAKPGCPDTAGTNAESGAEFRGAIVHESTSVATTTVVGACSSPRVEIILSGKLLQKYEDVK